MNRTILVLAVGASLAVNLLVVGGIIAVLNRDAHFIVSDNYVAMITGTLGVLLGSLASLLGRGHCPHCHHDDAPDAND